MRSLSWRPGRLAGVAAVACGLLGGCAKSHPKGGWIPPGRNELPPVFVIEVDDPVEAALLQQELGLKPLRVVGRKLYYEDGTLNHRLAELGYQPGGADVEAVRERVVRVARAGGAQTGLEQALREAGALVVLRERDYLVVRGSFAGLRMLTRLGFRLEELGDREPRPRQVSVDVAGLGQVGEVARAGVDIYSVGPVPQDQERVAKRGYVVSGSAFDYAIDTLRERGFSVKVEADPQGVVR